MGNYTYCIMAYNHKTQMNEIMQVCFTSLNKAKQFANQITNLGAKNVCVIREQDKKVYK